MCSPLVTHEAGGKSGHGNTRRRKRQMYRKSGRTYPRINRADDEELVEKIQQDEAEKIYHLWQAIKLVEGYTEDF